jgi:membrane associated rhomboid family serine protease
MDRDEPTDIRLCDARERAQELSLVLAAQGIESQLRFDGGGWVLSVAADAVAAAERELAAYTAEASRAVKRNAPPPVHGRPWPGIVAYLAIIMAVASTSVSMSFGVDWLARGGVNGARIFDGEWWRPITALTLHANAAHLLGNAVFGSFFGYSVARYLGGGAGWLAILVCGSLGNLANVLLSGANHRAIGASTAVFAALGLLTAWCWRRGFPPGASRRERFAPVVAGIGLLAFTGAGGVGTDVGAHLTGFVAGFAGGLGFARFGVPQSSRVQLACGGVALTAVALAWIAALLGA